MVTKILERGAEAVVYLDKGLLVKERIVKGYRVPEIDNLLRKQRTKREGKLLEKSRGIKVPRLHDVDLESMRLTMEFIDGPMVKDILGTISIQERKKMCQVIGKQIAYLHAHDIIHGDLTTSNMIYKEGVYFIDFGLGFISHKLEDKAVDLHLLRQALESRHHSYWEAAYRAVLSGYSTYSHSSDVLDRLDKVEKRGRYKRKGVSYLKKNLEE